MTHVPDNFDEAAYREELMKRNQRRAQRIREGKERLTTCLPIAVITKEDLR
jgi:hypothetical protein